jgi:hypothetical protein
MDLHDIAQALTPSGARIRFRQATVVNVAADGDLTVIIGGSIVPVSGVKTLSSVCVTAGSDVWLVTDGVDLFAFGTIQPVGPAYCSVHRASDQTIATSTDTVIDFLSGATHTDTHDMFVPSLATNQITAWVPGVYLLTASIGWDFNATGRRDLRLTVNGANVAADYQQATPSTRGNRQSVSVAHELAIGDDVQISVTQNSGGNLAVLTLGANSPRLTATWLRGPT